MIFHFNLADRQDMTVLEISLGYRLWYCYALAFNGWFKDLKYVQEVRHRLEGKLYTI